MMAFDFPFGIGLLAQLLDVEVLVDGEVWEDCGGRGARFGANLGI